MHLVIIEAPGKLKKLRSLLPSIRPDVTWQVEATAGHIRDLPAVVPILRRSSAIAESFAEPMVFLEKCRKTTLRDGSRQGWGW